MSFIRFAFLNLWYYRLSTSIAILLLVMGLGIICIMYTTGFNVEKYIYRSGTRVDAVLAAKGSPLQSVLANIYHIDQATGNISRAEAERQLHNPMVKSYLELAYGDRVGEYRLLGVGPAYREFYGLELTSGRWLLNPYELIIDESLAEKMKWNLGDKLLSQHAEGEQSHGQDLTIVGICKRYQAIPSVVLLTSLETVWGIHGHGDGEITAALLRFKTPMAALTVPGKINRETRLMASIPAIEINRLMSFMSNVRTFFQILGVFITTVAGLSVYLSLLNNLRERKREWLFMRLQGGSQRSIFVLLFLEVGVIMLSAFVVLASILFSVNLFALENLEAFGFDEWVWPLEMLLLIPGALILGTLAVIPVYRHVIRHPLNFELQ